MYFLDRRTQIDSLSIYGASVIGVLLLSLVIEMLNFIKWYMVVRKRITMNCLMSFVVDVN